MGPGTFAITTALPMARWHHTVAVSGCDLFVLGGKYGTTLSSPSTTDVIAAHAGPDGMLGSWTTEPSLENGRSRATATIVGKAFVFVNTDSQAALLP